MAGLTAARARGRVGGRPSKLSAEQRRQARKMYDERELTVEQIGQVLGVSRTSIYRALGHTAAPASPGVPAPTRTAEPAAAVAAPPDTVEVPVPVAAPTPTPTPTPASGAPPAVRSRGRSRWFVVEADSADPEQGPVVVVSGHTSQSAATTALRRVSSRRAPGAGEGSLLQVRWWVCWAPPAPARRPAGPGRRTTGGTAPACSPWRWSCSSGWPRCRSCWSSSVTWS